MPQQATIIRVFVASPSDVQEESESVQTIVAAWNAVNSSSMNIILEAVLWETHSYPQQGRPQGILNEQLGECDLLIGIFWSKFGSSTGVADSGTLEEINEYIGKNKPVLLYFSDRTRVEGTYDLEQFAKVQAFREAWSSKGLYSAFASTNEFKEKLTRHLHQHVLAFDEAQIAKSRKLPPAVTQNQNSGANSINIQSGRDSNIN